MYGEVSFTPFEATPENGNDVEVYLYVIDRRDYPDLDYDVKQVTWIKDGDIWEKVERKIDFSRDTIMGISRDNQRAYTLLNMLLGVYVMYDLQNRTKYKDLAVTEVMLTDEHLSDSNGDVMNDYTSNLFRQNNYKYVEL